MKREEFLIASITYICPQSAASELHQRSTENNKSQWYHYTVLPVTDLLHWMP